MSRGQQGQTCAATNVKGDSHASNQLPADDSHRPDVGRFAQKPGCCRRISGEVYPRNLRKVMKKITAADMPDGQKTSDETQPVGKRRTGAVARSTTKKSEGVMAQDRNPAQPPDLKMLRSGAQGHWRNRPVPAELRNSPEFLPLLVHQLQLYQLELEIQNEELRRTRGEIEGALERYTELYNFAPVGYVSLGRDGIIRAANLTLASLMGLEPDQCINRPFSQFLVIEEHQRLASLLDRVFDAQLRDTCEVELARREGQRSFVQLEAVAASSGQECRIAVLDISQRRQMEEQIQRQHAELTAANKNLDAFNYSVAHDLRLPLGIVHGYCEIFQELCKHQLDAESSDYLRVIHESARRMDRLITALLRLSSASAFVLSRVKVDLSAMAAAVARELTHKRPEQRKLFRIVDDISVNADSVLLRLVMDNLMGNALKYAGSRDGGVIEVGVQQLDGEQTCFVRDNGPGFNMDDATGLFTPFQRLSSSLAGGYGIGLATVQRIIHRHGGRVWAESSPGKGAVFFFTLGSTVEGLA